MKEFWQSLFGEFYGNILYTLLDATQWTIYLSLTAFVGGGLLGLIITALRITPMEPTLRELNQFGFPLPMRRFSLVRLPPVTKLSPHRQILMV
jgi:ABC-type amino acid transport system permease subunit